MEILLTSLCVLGFVLLVVAVVGHGIWLLGAAIVRALSGDREQDRQPARPCPSCGRLGTVVSGRCTACGAVPAISVETTLTQELAATARHLERLLKRGILEANEYERLMDSIRADLARLQTAHVPRLDRPAVAAAPRPASAPPHGEAIVDAALVEEPQRAMRAPQPPPVLRSVTLPPVVPTIERPSAEGAALTPARSGREVHPLDRVQPKTAAVPPKPSTPARTLADILQSFMEESNIRWGEVIAGILIVVCAIGLVISLRSTLKEIPYAPALLFMIFTVVFHGAGMYSLRRWKLQAISRVILIIALLLVPLGFSAGIVLSGSGKVLRPVTDPYFLAAIVIGTLVFGWVTISSARETVGSAWWRLSIAVLGSSLAQVLVNRLAATEMTLPQILLLAGVPLVCFLLAAGGQLVASRLRARMNRLRVIEMFLVIGIAAFALMAPLALLIHLSEHRLTTLARLTPTISLAASAVLASGLSVHRRALAGSLAPYRMAGTTVAVLGAITMLGMVALAWPQPDLLLAVGLANCVVLFALGAVSGIAPLHGAALGCGALASVVAAHLFAGKLLLDEATSSQLVHVLLTCRSGVVLTALAAVAGVVGWQLARSARRSDALVFLGGASVFSLMSALVAAFVGFVPADIWVIESAQDALWAAPLLIVHAVVLIAAAPAVRHPAAAVAGSAVLWLGLVHAVAWNATARHALEVVHLLPERPVLCATLAHSVVAALAAIAAGWRGWLADAKGFADQERLPLWKHLVHPLSLTAAAALAGSLPFIVWVQPVQLYWHAAYAAWGAVVCLALVLLWRHPVAFGSLQGMAALAAGMLTAAICRTQLGGGSWHLDWRHFDAQMIVVALAAAIWTAIRRVSVRWPVVRQVVAPHEVTVDQALLAVAVIATPLLAIVGVWPGIVRELGATQLSAEMPLARWAASAGSLGDWLVVVAVAGALLALLVEGRHRDAMAGLVAVLFAVPWLAAGWYADEIAVASAARWLAAGYVAILSGLCLAGGKLAGRDGLLGRVGTWAARPIFAIWPFVLGTIAILAITFVVVGQSLAGQRLGGPAAGSWFAILGPTLSFGIPLSVLVVMSLAFSIAWRQAGMSILASALFQLTVNLAFLVHLSDSTDPVTVRWVEWLQWNALGLGVFGLVWSAVEEWKKYLDAARSVRGADLATERLGNLAQLFLCGLAVRALAAWAAGAVALDPNQQLFVTPQLGNWTSYAALGLASAFLLWRSQRRLPYMGLGIVAVCAMLAAFAAATCDGLDPLRQWLAYHVLTMGLLGVSTLAAVWYAVGRWAVSTAENEPRPLNWPVPSHWAAAAGAGLVTLLAWRGVWSDPQAPWWSVGAALGAVAIFNGLALVRRSQEYAYVGTLLAIGPVAIFLSDPPKWAVDGRTVFGEACSLAPLLVAIFWLWMEVRSQKREQASFASGAIRLPVHHFAAVAGVGALGWLVGVRLLMGMLGAIDHLGWSTQILIELALGAALGVSTGLLIASLWDRRAFHTLPCLYASGLILVGFLLHLLRWYIIREVNAQRIPPFNYVELVLSASSAALACYVALTGELWKRGAHLSLWGQRLGVSDPVAGLTRTVRWLPAVNILLTAGVCGLSFFAVLALESLALRVMAGIAPAIAAWGLARQAQQEREAPLQMTALGLAGLSAVLLGWAELPPVYTDQAWMTRMFRLLMVLSALTFLYGLGLPRLLFVEGPWHYSLRRAGYGAAVLAMATFIAVLALEFVWFVPGQGAPVGDVQVAAVAVVLLALIAGLISLALFPDRDPLALSETGRTGYVYAAEAVLSLLFAHVYLCKPMWFDGVLKPYWPYIVMGIAYIGVGAGELFTKMRLRMLAEPLRNTGALMPLLPAIAMWVAAPKESDYALVLFMAGVMYLFISVTQRSWMAAAAAGVAGNGALWTILHRGEFDFTQNPQFWLIPPAVSVLIGAHVNRHRLDPKLLAAIRYAATIVIYLSSTSEVFLRGIGTTLWPPMVLLGLSLIGALAGVMLRIRAFLYLGAGFTLMALITMVAHAARAIDEIWPWWAFGIGAGIALLGLFALFEKKREEVTALVTWLKQWEQ